MGRVQARKLLSPGAEQLVLGRRDFMPFYAPMGKVQTPCWDGQTRDLALLTLD